MLITKISHGLDFHIMKQLLLKNNKHLLASMPEVGSYKTQFSSLNSWWEKITLIGKINSYNIANTILNDMVTTKNKFNELQDKLIDSLLVEHLQKTVIENTAISQVTIDILIRNLFERTADVGFLATDKDTRQFLLSPDSQNQLLPQLEQRLTEYVKKYSVYDEIVILGTDGKVLAHLDQDNPITHSNDPLVQVTLDSTEEYVETFRKSDLQPLLRHSLIYSQKIRLSDDPHSSVIGILCLCFRFDNEVTSIFNKLLHDTSHNTILILDSNENIIASSDEQYHPVGSKSRGSKDIEVFSIKQKYYLSIRTVTTGYEGFNGLDWTAQIITPLDKAFNHQEKHSNYSVDDTSANFEKSTVFSSELKHIKKDSVEINDDLSLLVLNGKITSARKDAAEFMPVLQSIQTIGEDIANIFLSSVDSLETTVVSSLLNNAQFKASLAVDIMDRNLYERANDSRWWALTSDFRAILAQGSMSESDISTLSAILASINELYTVYTNIYIYDTNGKIVAVSNKDERGIVGSIVDESTAATAALNITDSQKYTVSDFASNELYSQQYTYIYNAAITHLETSKVLGGIGLVFDSQPQFKAILTDTLPVDNSGEIVSGCFAVFTDREKRIISVANNTELAVGDTLALDEHFFIAKNGSSFSEIITYNASSYAVGYAVTNGYREYKTTNDYINDVIAFIFIPF